MHKATHAIVSQANPLRTEKKMTQTFGIQGTPIRKALCNTLEWYRTHPQQKEINH
jgi:hypothetical protein